MFKEVLEVFDKVVQPYGGVGWVVKGFYEEVLSVVEKVFMRFFRWLRRFEEVPIFITIT